MPVMDGLEATRRIREFEQSQKLPRSLIVALTGMASGKVQQEAFGSGVDFFLPKPVRLNQLTELIDDKGLGNQA
jgi:CheY-like chemotaxis protein